MEQRYDASAIQVLRGLEGVRTRPAMYIGSTDAQGAFHCVEEVLDNAIDEFASGFCTRIEVVLSDGGRTIRIKDNGRGIPIDIHPEIGLPALEVVLTTLHAGGKFDKKAYSISAGLHGVGVSVVTALSEYLKAEVWRDGKYAVQEFSRGQKLTELVTVDDPGQKETGTAITFRLDPQVFGKHVAINADRLRERLHELVCLNPGLEIILLVEQQEPVTYKSERGLVDLLETTLKERRRNILHAPVTIERSGANYRLQVVLVWTPADSEFVQSYVNSVRTPDGGTHESGLRAALTRVISGRAEAVLAEVTGGTRRRRKGDEVEITGDCVREGLMAFLHLQLASANLEFVGQTKTKLGNPEARSLVYEVVSEGLRQVLEEQPELARAIVNRVVTAARAKAAAKAARERERERAQLSSSAGESFKLGVLPGKLADCTVHGPEAELFIVEGDSAGGSGKSARDRRYQAVLPLRGKSLNVERATPQALARNEELKAIAIALGVQFGKPVEFGKLRYGKVVITSDADSDGSHIRTLLLTFFFRCFPELVYNGYIWVARAPLYCVRAGADTVLYAYSEHELNQLVERLGRRKLVITRFKGLGEMRPEQLAETVFDPRTRVLQQVTVEDVIRADALVKLLMGKDSGMRRWFIEQYADLANLDV